MRVITLFTLSSAFFCHPLLPPTPPLTFCTSSLSISFLLPFLYFYSCASCFPLLLSFTLFLLFTILLFQFFSLVSYFFFSCSLLCYFSFESCSIYFFNIDVLISLIFLEGVQCKRAEIVPVALKRWTGNVRILSYTRKFIFQRVYSQISYLDFFPVHNLLK